jgi:hypothetical protein
MDTNRIEGLEDVSNVRSMPAWDDAANHSLVERARTYLDVNCAHCQTEGGNCDL